ncbi:MAG: hypothetical protein IJ700_01430 [Bacteroidaceae bacterium]|nr:hypothetical protein [Bacteroidaceae bacterium]
MPKGQNEYQVFIASSLHLTEHRSAVQAAIEEVNEKLALDNVCFSEFFYERRPDFTQKVEKIDAQAPADRALCQSTLFFLIIDEQIRSLTRYEFEAALANYQRGELPQYLIIFYNEQTAKESNEVGMSYDDFMKYENLETYMADNRNQVVGHRRVYSIPFSDMSQLKNKAADELMAFAMSKERPFPDAVRGNKLTKELFFTDVRRREKCTELYLRRKFDDDLDEALRSRRVIVVSGPSLSGKTRAVMEALKNVNDGWIYVFRDRFADMETWTRYFVSQTDRLLAYAATPDVPKLYVVLDNLEQLVEIEEISDALRSFLSKIDNTNISVVATSSVREINFPGVNPRENPHAAWLEIKEMEGREFSEAKRFFLSAGVPLDERNMRYRRTGALFVDLNSILGDYQRWQKQGNDLMKLAKRMLLKAIKAISMWRDDSIGDRQQLLKLATWFCQKDLECEWEQDEIEEACRRALNSLVTDGRMGISSRGNDAPVIIQEYIYRYFIGRDGYLLNGDESFSEEDEKALARVLLSFCNHNVKDEALTVQVSRICRRCTYRSQTTRWLYHLWMGESVEGTADKNLSRLLCDDRQKCENGALANIHFYSNVIETFIYYGCQGYSEALAAYAACPKTLRTDHLLSALMRKAQTTQERDEIRAMEDYKKMKNEAYVISVEVEWAPDYDGALQAFSRFSLSEDAVEIARLLLDTEKPYDIYQLRKAVGALALKVSDIEQFTHFCNVLRTNFLYLLSDIGILEDIRSRRISFHVQQPTLIDLLSVLTPYVQAQLLNRVYGSDLDACQEFIAELLGCIGATLDGRFTDETAMRMVVSSTTSYLIRSFANTSYDEVYNTIFAPLKIRHPRQKDTWLILRNSFTYTAMLDNVFCGIQQAENLMENDLIPHARDARHNPLYINTYTLNKMIDKSRGEKKRIYADMINVLYDQLHKQRDSFTYSRLIALAANLYECYDWLNRMYLQGVKPNVFVVGELMARPEVDLPTALNFLNLSGVALPDGYEPLTFEWEQGHDNSTFDPNTIVDQMREELSRVNIGWGHLFEKSCQDDKDREVLSACLSYLESEQPQLLRDGYIYNNIIKNITYLQTFEEAMDMILRCQERGLFNADTYTFNHLVNRIADMQGKPERLWAIDQLNGLLSQADVEVRTNNIIVCNRLKIYKDHKEALKMVFCDAQGKVDICQVSAAGYVEAMCKWHYPVDSYAIANLIGQKNERTANTYRRLMRVLVNQQEYYTLTPKDIKIIREGCRGYYEQYAEKIPALQAPLPIHLFNKNIAWHYWKHEQDINEALTALDWSNPNSALSAYNSILNNFIDAQRKVRATPGLFDVVMSYYQHSIKNVGRAPSSATFSIMAKATSSWDEMRALLNEFDIQKQKYPRLTLQPQILAHMSSQVRSIRELVERTNLLYNKGCPYSSTGADVYVFRMVRYLRGNDIEHTEPILSDLLRYLVDGGDSDMLVKDEREYLMLGLYEEPSNVSHHVWRTMIYYNATLPDGVLYGTERIVACIAEKYYDCAESLMNELLKDVQSKDKDRHLPISGNDIWRIKKMIAREYIPRLFYCLREASRPFLSSSLLSYLVSMLPDIKAYNHFTQQLYKVDCREIDKIVPVLAKFLKDKVESRTLTGDVYKAVCKTLAQLLVYSDISLLRNGDLLIEKAPGKYAAWCRRPMDSAHIREELKGQYHCSLSDKIRLYTKHLEDAYPCSLMTIYRHKELDGAINEAAMAILRKQERDYARRLRSEEVPFRDVIRFPLLWVRAKWHTTDEFVAAMMLRLGTVAMTEEDENRAAAQERISAIEQCFDNAYHNGSEYLFIRYTLIGTLPSENTYTYKMPKEAAAFVVYQLRLMRMAALAAGKDYEVLYREAKYLATAERLSASFIQQGTVDFETLNHLPQQWLRIHVKKGIAWQPHTGIVLAILERYARWAFEDVAQADTCLSYLLRINTAISKARFAHYENVRIRYNMIGSLPLEDARYIEIGEKLLHEVIPHRYLLALRVRSAGGSHDIGNGDKWLTPPNMLKMQAAFTEAVCNGSYTVQELSQLAQLWYKARWKPSEALVLAILRAYKDSTEEFASTCMGQITKELSYCTGAEYHLKYVNMGLFPKNNDYYYVIDAGKLRKVIEI